MLRNRNKPDLGLTLSIKDEQVIILKTGQEIAKMRRSGEIVASVLKRIGEVARPGVATSHLDKIARRMMKESGGEPSFLGYKGFPASICTSINEVVVHGIPGDRKLSSGDILSVDVGVKLDGYHADAATTFVIGDVPDSAKKLIDVTKDAFFAGLDQARTGNRLGDISWAIQNYVESHNFSVVKVFVGHGIGTQMHEEPEIPNYGRPNSGPLLKEGMVLAIEPMVNEKKAEIEILEDGWTAVTVDGGLSAHYEHTIAITDEGARILTE